MTASAHIRLANEHHASDPWQLDLPNDPAAAAEYLRGVERSRRTELEAIVRLRRRIEGRRQDLRISYRLAAAIAVLIVVLGTFAAAGLLAGGAQDAARSAGHAGHAGAGSGVAVTLDASGPSSSRAHLEAGTSTFVLRNEGSAAAMLILARSDAAQAAATSPMVQPGERLEWSTSVKAGTYVLRSHVEGSAPVAGPTLTVG